MLDDFKTELKKLIYARMERQEAGRGSMAVANQDPFLDLPDEIEFARQVNNTSRSMSMVEVIARDPQYGQQRDTRVMSGRPLIGRTGKKLFHLPLLRPTTPLTTPSTT